MDDWWPVALAGGAALLEAVPGLGVVLPGEVVITGAAVKVGDGSLRVLWVTVVVAAWSGDQANFWIARAGGRRLGLVPDEAAEPSGRLQQALRVLRAHGAPAVVVGRLLPFVRSFVPAAAGIVRLPPAAFALASACGCALWASLWLGVGSWSSRLLGWPVLVLVVVAVGVVVTARWVVVSRRRAAIAG